MLRIHCDYCHQSWEVYHRDNWSEPQTRQCPHCFHEVPESAWEQVLDAFGTLSDANIELARLHEWEHVPLFRVDYVEDYQFPGFEAVEAVTALENGLADMEQRILDRLELHTLAAFAEGLSAGAPEAVEEATEARPLTETELDALRAVVEGEAGE